MIRNPNDIQDGAKKIRMLIAGYPVRCTSTVISALTASSPGIVCRTSSPAAMTRS